MRQDLDLYISRFFNGDRRALARLISIVEDGSERASYVLSKIFKKVGRAHRIGITGPPGAGKSTLLDKIAIEMKRNGEEVYIIAVDPTSPFTGGALLGDRYRMTCATDEGIFIRSLATRGSLGGLSEATIPVADLMDAFGADSIFIETIGVGQTELDVMDASDTVVVVLVPESGDSIQAMKAGLMEIGDIFIINKYDRAGSSRFENELRSIFNLFYSREGGWIPPIVRTVATEGLGVDELLEEIKRHREYLKRTGLFERKRKERIKKEILQLLKERLMERVKSSLNLEEDLERYVDEVYRGMETPYSVVDKILRELR